MIKPIDYIIKIKSKIDAKIYAIIEKEFLEYFRVNDLKEGTNNSQIIYDLYYSNELYTIEQIWTRNFVCRNTLTNRRKMYNKMFKCLVEKIKIKKYST